MGQDSILNPLFDPGGNDGPGETQKSRRQRSKDRFSRRRKKKDDAKGQTGVKSERKGTPPNTGSDEHNDQVNEILLS